VFFFFFLEEFIESLKNIHAILSFAERKLQMLHSKGERMAKNAMYICIKDPPFLPFTFLLLVYPALDSPPFLFCHKLLPTSLRPDASLVHAFPFSSIYLQYPARRFRLPLAWRDVIRAQVCFFSFFCVFSFTSRSRAPCGTSSSHGTRSAPRSGAPPCARGSTASSACATGGARGGPRGTGPPTRASRS